MAVSHFTGDHYQGLSTDSKPSANVGSTFLETDTGARFVNVDGASTWTDISHIGSVGGHTTVVSQTPTIGTAIYAAKEAVGGKLTFANAVRVSGGTGVVQAVTIIDDDSESAELTLALFGADFTATADGTAFAPSDADLENCLGIVKVLASDYQAFANNAVATRLNVGLPFKLTTGTSIYGQLLCVATPTYTAPTDLTVKLHVFED